VRGGCGKKEKLTRKTSIFTIVVFGMNNQKEEESTISRRAITERLISGGDRSGVNQ